MTVKVEMRDSLHRLIDTATGHIAKGDRGVATDGGGYTSKNKANRHAGRINSAERSRSSNGA
jgi:hypothetical protein